jgi:DNA-directed RNA polymerase specialized sigma24 family protein
MYLMAGIGRVVHKFLSSRISVLSWLYIPIYNQAILERRHQGLRQGKAAEDDLAR